MAEKSVNVSLILAEKIIALFDEAGATKTERYCAINVVTAMIPVSINEQRDDQVSELP